MTEHESILFEGLTAYEEENGPSLDIYVNIQQILDPLLHNYDNTLVYKLALYLFISLTSSD